MPDFQNHYQKQARYGKEGPVFVTTVTGVTAVTSK